MSYPVWFRKNFERIVVAISIVLLVLLSMPLTIGNPYHVLLLACILLCEYMILRFIPRAPWGSVFSREFVDEKYGGVQVYLVLLQVAQKRDVDDTVGLRLCLALRAAQKLGWLHSLPNHSQAVRYFGKENVGSKQNFSTQRKKVDNPEHVEKLEAMSKKLQSYLAHIQKESF